MHKEVSFLFTNISVCVCVRVCECVCARAHVCGRDALRGIRCSVSTAWTAAAPRRGL